MRSKTAIETSRWACLCSSERPDQRYISLESEAPHRDGKECSCPREDHPCWQDSRARAYAGNHVPPSTEKMSIAVSPRESNDFGRSLRR